MVLDLRLTMEIGCRDDNLFRFIDPHKFLVEKVIQRKLETFLFMQLNDVIPSITLLNRGYSVNIPK